jgi:hypothetical protein
MRMIRPRLDAPQITIAEEQDEFKPVTAALVYNPLYAPVQTDHGALNAIVLAFRPDAEERAQLAAGEDIYVSLLTFLRPMPGIIVGVGSRDMAAMFNVAEEVPDAPH